MVPLPPLDDEECAEGVIGENLQNTATSEYCVDREQFRWLLTLSTLLLTAIVVAILLAWACCRFVLFVFGKCDRVPICRKIFRQQ